MQSCHSAMVGTVLVKMGITLDEIVAAKLLGIIAVGIMTEFKHAPFEYVLISVQIESQS